jgi:hypothetical protein
MMFESIEGGVLQEKEDTAQYHPAMAPHTG